MRNSISNGAVPQPEPMILNGGDTPPPFLSKTYDMVDDPSTDSIVSWGPKNNSFIVWNHADFAKDLLPKYFKHNNVASFVRQLNTYGFRKVDADRFEFANERFLRGRKDLLKNIPRRKSDKSHSQHQPQQLHRQNGACVEVGKFGLEEEIDMLKRDKNVLMQELVRLRQQQQATDNQLQEMVQHLQGMEQRQQQMLSFLAKAVQSPGFLAQFVQQQTESNRRVTETNKKRRLRQDDNFEGEVNSPALPSDGQIVKYQPPVNEAAKAMFREIMNTECSSQLKTSENDPRAFFIGDVAQSFEAMDSAGLTRRLSGVTLQEVPSEIQASSQPGSDSDRMIHEVSEMLEIDPESMVNMAENDDSRFTEIDGSMATLQIEDICPDDPQINALAEDDNSFWEELLARLPDDVDSTFIDDLSIGNENVDQLTEQMDHLSSDAKKSPPDCS